MRRTYIESLKKAVEEKFTRRVLSSAECNELVEAIFKKTGQKLNPNTLRRVYGLVKSPYLPSYSTANTLSLYCGYKSFDDFVNNSNGKEPVLSNSDPLFQYMEMVFHQLEVEDVNDPTYVALVKNTINFLKQRPELIEPFQRLAAKTSNGQRIYYEHLVNLDELNSFYGDGLYHYLNEKNTKEAQIFANSLLCFKGWLTLDNATFMKHYNEVIKHTIDSSIHPFVTSRYFGVQLLHAELYGKDKGGIMAEARLFFEKLSKNQPSFPRFELIMSDILIQVNEYEEALFYIEKALKRKKENLSPHYDRHLLIAFRLYKAIALIHTGKDKQAKALLDGLVPSEFYFLSQQYYTVLYLRTKYHFQQRKNVLDQICHLIEATGFKRFYRAIGSVFLHVVPALNC